jgi:hypothetical protein
MIRLVFPLLACLLAAPSWAAIAQVGAGEGCFSLVNTTHPKTVNCTTPAGTADNHVVFGFAFSTSNQATNPITLTEPAGMTVVREHSLVMNTTRTNAFGIYYKVAAGEGATYAFTADDGTASQIALSACVLTLSGVKINAVLDTPYVTGSHEVTTDTDLLAGSATDAPDITTVTSGAWVLTFLGANLDNILTLTEPSGMTLDCSNVGNARNFGVAHINAGAAGAESLGAWGYTESGATTTRGILATLAVRPTLNAAAFRRRH